ncbi:hypothetical protein RYX36_027434 [Vicia faba]
MVNKQSELQERFCDRIHFEFDKGIACEVCVRVCPIDLPVVDWKMETDIRKKRLLNYIIDFGICIFCAIAAAEAAIGLAIVSSIAHNRKSTRINQSNLLNK